MEERLNVWYNLAKSRGSELFKTKHIGSTVAGEDDEENFQRNQAARAYVAAATILFTTLHNSKTEELQAVVRDESLAKLPLDLFDQSEWIKVLDRAQRWKQKIENFAPRQGGSSPLKPTASIVSEDIDIEVLKDSVNQLEKSNAPASDVRLFKKQLIPVLEKERKQYRRLKQTLRETELKYNSMLESSGLIESSERQDAVSMFHGSQDNAFLNLSKFDLENSHLNKKQLKGRLSSTMPLYSTALEEPGAAPPRDFKEWSRVLRRSLKSEDFPSSQSDTSANKLIGNQSAAQLSSSAKLSGKAIRPATAGHRLQSDATASAIDAVSDIFDMIHLLEDYQKAPADSMGSETVSKAVNEFMLNDLKSERDKLREEVEKVQELLFAAQAQVAKQKLHLNALVDSESRSKQIQAKTQAELEAARREVRDKDIKLREVMSSVGSNQVVVSQQLEDKVAECVKLKAELEQQRKLTSELEQQHCIQRQLQTEQDKNQIVQYSQDVGRLNQTNSLLRKELKSQNDLYQLEMSQLRQELEHVRDVSSEQLSRLQRQCQAQTNVSDQLQEQLILARGELARAAAAAEQTSQQVEELSVKVLREEKQLSEVDGLVNLIEACLAIRPDEQKRSGDVCSRLHIVLSSVNAIFADKKSLELELKSQSVLLDSQMNASLIESQELKEQIKSLSDQLAERTIESNILRQLQLDRGNEPIRTTSDLSTAPGAGGVSSSQLNSEAVADAVAEATTKLEEELYVLSSKYNDVCQRLSANSADTAAMVDEKVAHLIQGLDTEKIGRSKLESELRTLMSKYDEISDALSAMKVQQQDQHESFLQGQQGNTDQASIPIVNEDEDEAADEYLDEFESSDATHDDKAPVHEADSVLIACAASHDRDEGDAVQHVYLASDDKRLLSDDINPQESEMLTLSVNDTISVSGVLVKDEADSDASVSVGAACVPDGGLGVSNQPLENESSSVQQGASPDHAYRDRPSAEEQASSEVIRLDMIESIRAIVLSQIEDRLHDMDEEIVRERNLRLQVASDLQKLTTLYEELKTKESSIAPSTTAQADGPSVSAKVSPRPVERGPFGPALYTDEGGDGKRDWPSENELYVDKAQDKAVEEELFVDKAQDKVVEEELLVDKAQGKAVEEELFVDKAQDKAVEEELFVDKAQDKAVEEELLVVSDASESLDSHMIKLASFLFSNATIASALAQASRSVSSSSADAARFEQHRAYLTQELSAAIQQNELLSQQVAELSATKQALLNQITDQGARIDEYVATRENEREAQRLAAQQSMELMSYQDSSMPLESSTMIVTSAVGTQTDLFSSHDDESQTQLISSESAQSQTEGIDMTDSHAQTESGVIVEANSQTTPRVISDMAVQTEGCDSIDVIQDNHLVPISSESEYACCTSCVLCPVQRPPSNSTTRQNVLLSLKQAEAFLANYHITLAQSACDRAMYDLTFGMSFVEADEQECSALRHIMLHLWLVKADCCQASGDYETAMSLYSNIISCSKMRFSAVCVDNCLLAERAALQVGRIWKTLGENSRAISQLHQVAQSLVHPGEVSELSEEESFHQLKELTKDLKLTGSQQSSNLLVAVFTECAAVSVLMTRYRHASRLLNAAETILSSFGSELSSAQRLSQADIRHQQGLLLFALGRYKEAQSFLQISLVQRLEILGQESGAQTHPMVAECYVSKGRVHIARCEYASASKELEQAKSILVNSLPNTSHVSLAAVYFHQGSLQHLIGNYSEARQLIQDSLDITKQVLASSGLVSRSPSGSVVSLETASLNPDLTEASASSATSHNWSNTLVANCLLGLAEVECALSNFPVAEIYLREVINIHERCGCIKWHAPILDALFSTARLKERSGLWLEAKALYEQCLELRQECHRRHQDIAVFHKMSSHSGSPAAHDEHKEESQEIVFATPTKKVPSISSSSAVKGTEHQLSPVVEYTRLRLGYVLCLLSRFSDSKAILSSVGQALCMCLGNKHTAVAEGLYVLGVLYSKCGKYSFSKRLLARAVDIYKVIFVPPQNTTSVIDPSPMLTAASPSSSFGATHPLIADALLALAVNALYPGQTSVATEYCERADEIYRLHLPSNSVEMAMSNILFGLINIYNQNFSSALTRLDVAMNSLSASCGVASVLFATVLASKGECLRQSGDFEAALPLLNEALALACDTAGPEHLLVAELLVSAASLYMDTHDVNNCHSALEILEKQAEPILKVIFEGEMHPIVSYCRGSAGLCLHILQVILLSTGDDSAQSAEDAERGQTMMDNALDYFDLYDQSPFADNHPWVIRFGGWTSASPRSQSTAQSPRPEFTVT